MFLDSSSGFTLRRSNPKMVVSLHSTLIHGSHIWTLPWSSVSSAYTDSDPVSQLVLVHLREATPSFFSTPISVFLFCFIVQVVCPWLSLLTSSYKPGVLQPMWSAEPSTGWACSWWGCCSVTLWWETCSYLSFKVGHAHRGVAGIVIVTQDLTTTAIPLMGSDPVFPSRMTSARSASWFSWLTPSPAVHFCWGLFQRPKERQWWR